MNSLSCFIDPSLLIPYGRECSSGLKALKRAWNAARTHPPGAKAAADRRRNLQGAHPGRGGFPERGKNYDGDKTHFLKPHRHFSKEAVHMPSGRMRNTQHLESPGGFESKPRGGAVGHPLGRPPSETQEVTGVGGDVGRRHPVHRGRGAERCGCCGSRGAVPQKIGAHRRETRGVRSRDAPKAERGADARAAVFPAGLLAAAGGGRGPNVQQEVMDTQRAGCVTRP